MRKLFSCDGRSVWADPPMIVIHMERPRCPSGAEHIGNGDERAPVIGLAIAQWRRQRRVCIELGIHRPGEYHPIGDIEVGLGIDLVLIESFQFAAAIAPAAVIFAGQHQDRFAGRAVHDRQRQRPDGGDRGRRKGRERAGLAMMVSRHLAAPAMPGIEHGAQRPVDGETEIVAFVDQQRWMLAVNGVINAAAVMLSDFNGRRQRASTRSRSVVLPQPRTGLVKVSRGVTVNRS